MRKVKKIKPLVLPISDDSPYLDFFIEIIDRVFVNNPRGKAIVMALLFLNPFFATACKENSEGTSTQPTKIEQLASQEEYPGEIAEETAVKASSTPSCSPSPYSSETPMDANFITPEIASSPLPLISFSDDQRSALEKEANNWYKRVKSSESPNFKFEFSDKEAQIVAKILCGDIIDIKDWNSLSDDQRKRTCEDFFNLVISFISSYSYNSGNSELISSKTKFYTAESYNLYKATGLDYNGVELLKTLETYKYAMFSCAISGQSDELLKASEECFKFLDDFYFASNGGELKNMYSSVPLLFCYEAGDALSFIVDVNNGNINAAPTGSHSILQIMQINESFKPYAENNLKELLLTNSEKIVNDDGPILTYSPSPTPGN
jgi:hypothetical protein